jgi:hypothetical protein
MIKKYIDKLFGRDRAPRKDGRPTVYGPDKHPIRREAISKCARRTCEELQRAGHAAFVVGGAVRDHLLGFVPKDYDVATSATPEEVRSIFRRSRIIGRRFQIVHVLCGQDVVETSTFRAQLTREADPDNTDEHGRVLSDNVFGTQAEDAARRDFTVNALFYDPVKEEVWDYHNGVKDLAAKKLVMIGDPALRYREDPVRMLRAARLAAKLGLTIDAKTEAPIHTHKHLIQNVPQSRLFEEILKLLLSATRWPAPSCCASSNCTTAFCRCSTTRWRTRRRAGSRSPPSRQRMTAFARTSPFRPRSCSQHSSGAASRRACASTRTRASRPSRPCTRRCTRRWTSSARRSPSRAASTPR